jgi:hypothetical protein
MSENAREAAEKAAALAKEEWGFIAGDGVFVPLPKLPLLLAGFHDPPFAVILPGGDVRHIIVRPT